MLRDAFLALDAEIVFGNNLQAVTHDPQIQARLGRYDQLGLHLRLTDVLSTGPFNVKVNIGTSPDGVWWRSVAQPLVHYVSNPYPGFFAGLDATVTPMMGLARLRVVTDTGFVRGRVRIFAALRDTGGGKPFAIDIGGGGRAS